MSVKGRLSVLAVMALAACTMLAALALMPPPPPPAYDGEAVPLPTDAPAPAGQELAQPAEPLYWIGERGGFVAVFDAENRDAPLRVTGIAVHTLRRADQVMIRDGVLIEGGEELIHFLEDFGP